MSGMVSMVPTAQGAKDAGTHVTVSGHHNNANTTNNTTNNNNVHVENVTVVINADGQEVVEAGSAEEGRLIHDMLLTNESFQAAIRQCRDMSLLPGLLFSRTKGMLGPRRLRNVRKVGRRVRRWTTEGMLETKMAEACREMAVEMMEHLHRALRTVYPTSPDTLLQWANPTMGNINYWSAGGKTFDQALKMYRDRDKSFYDLPEAGRRDVMECAKNIEEVISTEPNGPL